MEKLYDDNPYALPEENVKKKKSKILLLGKKNAMDIPLLIITLSLLAFGLVMLYSASYAVAYYRRDGDSTFFISKQLLFAFIGVVVMFIVSRIDYHIMHKLAWILYGASIVLLIVVLFMPPLNGARRWIFLPVGGNFQPSEVAKFAIIVLFSHIISKNYSKLKTFSYGVLPFVLVLIPIIVLMIMEPHLSGTVLILSIAVIMMFVGGTGIKWFLLGGGVCAGGVAAAIVIFPKLVPYAMERIETWRDPFLDTSDKGYQTIQGLLAIGSGGAMGLGLGNSRQKHLYVPEPYNDFIFSILCEELGFVGAVIVILMFVALLLRGLYIAAKARDKFGAMLVVGIIVQITIQAALNIAVVTATIPNTGISLPFFSYGGTSLLMLLGEMGVVLSVSRQANMEKT